MAFRTNSLQQYSFSDAVYNLTERERKALEKSWAKVFAEEIFPAIDEERFRVLYSDRAQSRSNTPVNIIVGALIIKEMFQISDDEVVENLMLDPRYQYALHTTSFDEQPLSDKTLSRFRKRCYDYEALHCIDLKTFNRNMADLLDGKRVELPYYNFVKGEREYKGNFLQLGPDDIMVIEGIHCLNDELSYALPKESKFKIYISALTQMNVDEHNRVPTTDGRLIRRMIRDARTRGASAQDTIRMWDSVRRGEERNIFPYQEEADVMFNSALLYELAVLKQYAEPILYSVPRDSEEYPEAKRLLKFLDYFLGVSSEQIPHNSILREFIGGSCFKV